MISRRYGCALRAPRSRFGRRFAGQPPVAVGPLRDRQQRVRPEARAERLVVDLSRRLRRQAHRAPFESHQSESGALCPRRSRPRASPPGGPECSAGCRARCAPRVNAATCTSSRLISLGGLLFELDLGQPRQVTLADGPCTEVIELPATGASAGSLARDRRRLRPALSRARLRLPFGIGAITVDQALRRWVAIRPEWIAFCTAARLTPRCLA
jgi:hypothetical protein